MTPSEESDEQSVTKNPSHLVTTKQDHQKSGVYTTKSQGERAYTEVCLH